MSGRIFLTVLVLTLFAISWCLSFGVPMKFTPLVLAPFVLTIVAIIWRHRA